MQKTVTKMQWVSLFTQNIPPMFVSLFIGPWSDRIGRKPLIMIPFFGLCWSQAVYLISSIFFDLPTEMLLLDIFNNIFGGNAVIWLGIYCYYADLSTHKTRTMKLAIPYVCWSTGYAIGLLFSGRIYEAFGYITIFSTSLTFYTGAVIYMALFIKESKKKDDYNKDSPPTKLGCLSLFDLSNIKGAIRTALAKREGNLRHILLLVVSLYFGGGMAFESNILDNQYVRQRFEWNSTDDFNIWFSQYSSITSFMELFSLGVLLPFCTQILGISDGFLIFISAFMVFNGYIIMLTAPFANLLYLYSCFSIFKGYISLGTRSGLSKLVDESDVGKVLSLISCVNGLLNMIGPTYNIVYVETLDWHPGFIYCVASVFLVYEMSVALYVGFFLRKHRRKQRTKDIDIISMASLSMGGKGGI